MSPGRDYKVESCVTSLAQAIDAQSRGADRVELCIRLETEGMTPDAELTKSLSDQLHIPVRVMVRATEAGYEADALALQHMLESIHALKQLPLDGFVFGVMKDDRIDRDAMIRLLQHAYPFPVTFHKAIDISSDIPDDIEWLNQFSQIDTILTSGGAIKAIDGVTGILEMKEMFRGNIMAAGKIIPEVLDVLHDQLGLQWYHGRAIL
ncbi:MAG TPA: copper homeostasis protein CutC [Saprospiraceae bacterium]|nr:copper homeostasis protein CutC [Saprospiraceae bacterium]